MGDYDAIVVGAGLGGLSASAFLARAGKHVLLLERHNVPGGYATSFVRGRFEFETSLHELSGLGHPDRRGRLWDLLNQCGVAEKVEFLPIPDFYRSVFPGLDMVIPCERQGWEDVLCAQFPKSADGIKRLTALMIALDDQVQRFGSEGQEAIMKDPGAFTELMTYTNATTAEVLEKEIPEPEARAVIAQLWGYYGAPPSMLSFILFAVATATYLKYGPAHIRGKSQAMSQAFVDVVEEQGGEVRLNTGVSRILTDDGRVRGVVTSAGEEILAPYVVCNVNPLVTCTQLIGADKIPSWYLKRLSWGQVGPGISCVYLGLDRDCEYLGLDHHEIAVNADYDLEAHWRGMSDITGEPPEVFVTPYNVVDFEASPPGTGNVVLAFLHDAAPWLKLNPAEYLEAKERMASSALDVAERLSPELRKHIEVMEVSTPITNMRFTSNPAGTYIGYMYTPQDTAVMRIPNRGPLEGLFFANAWVRLGGGYQTCINSGRQAAMDVLAEMKAGAVDTTAAEALKGLCEMQAADSPELVMEPGSIDAPGAKMHPERLKLKVQEITEETETAKTFRMVSANGELPLFRAGQYINLFVEASGVLTSRPYSISSRPGEPHYDLTVRRAPGGFVSHYLLDEVKVGDAFEATAPNGNFYHSSLVDGDNLVFLAGGSGITPFMSIIRDVLERDLPISIHLIYGSRKPSDIIFGPELLRLEMEHENFRMDRVIQEPDEAWTGLCGLMDTEMIWDLVGSIEGKTFYMCGPCQMYPFCEDALGRLQVPARLVKQDIYGAQPEVGMELDWPGTPTVAEFSVTEERSGTVLPARAGEPLMMALERAGLVIPAVCRSGECSACRTHLLDGQVWAPPRVRLRYADHVSGYIHPCMSYPLSDLRIRI